MFSILDITESIMQTESIDLDIDEIFNNVLANYPNKYLVEFDVNSLTQIFEFLLQFTTMLCKHFYSNSNGTVSLCNLSENELLNINNYLQCIGFSCNLQVLTANNYNINYAMQHRYDKINITPQTQLKELLFGLKCEQKLYVISFNYIV